MPIRTGSGGLKYALPNRAEIQARQNAAAASAGGSASASAYGTNRRYAGLKKQLQADFIQSGLDRGFRAQQNALDRDFRGYQAGQDRDLRQQLQQQGIEADAGLLDKRLEFQGAQSDLDFERNIDLGYMKGVQSGDLELPPDAQQALRKLESGRASLKDLTPDQQAEFEKRYNEERRRLIRSARPRESPTSTDTANQEITYFDRQQGRFVSEYAEGRVPFQGGKPLELPDTTENIESAKSAQAAQDHQSERQKAFNRFYGGLVGKDVDGEALSPEGARQKAEEYMREWDRINPAPQSGGGQAVPQGGGSPPFTPIGTAPAGPPTPTPTGTAPPTEPELTPPSGDPAKFGDLPQEQQDYIRQNTPEIGIAENVASALGMGVDDVGSVEDLESKLAGMKDLSPEKRSQLEFQIGSMKSFSAGQPITAKTPEQARLLPPGTKFIDPNGKERTVPTAAPLAAGDATGVGTPVDEPVPAASDNPIFGDAALASIPSDYMQQNATRNPTQDEFYGRGVAAAANEPPVDAPNPPPYGGLGSKADYEKILGEAMKATRSGVALSPEQEIAMDYRKKSIQGTGGKGTGRKPTEASRRAYRKKYGEKKKNRDERLAAQRAKRKSRNG